MLLWIMGLASWGKLPLNLTKTVLPDFTLNTLQNASFQVLSNTWQGIFTSFLLLLFGGNSADQFMVSFLNSIAAVAKFWIGFSREYFRCLRQRRLCPLFVYFRHLGNVLNLALWIVIIHCINGLWFWIPSWHSSCCWLFFEWRRNLLSFFCFVICWPIAFDSGPVLVMVLEKENAIADWRTLIGPTDAYKAKITNPNRLFTYKLLFLKPLSFIAL